MTIPNVKAKTATAHGECCFGCVATKSRLMLSFGSLTTYDGANRPSGEIDPDRILDVFLDEDAAKSLFLDLKAIYGKQDAP